MSENTSVELDNIMEDLDTTEQDKVNSKKKRAEDPMLVSTEGWSLQTYRDMTEYVYSLGYKQICRYLKCSRPWLHRFIRPNIHHIYVHQNIKNRIHIESQSCYNTQELIDFLKDHIASCQRRSIWIPLEILVPETKQKAWEEAINLIFEEEKNKPENPFSDPEEEERNLFNEIVKATGRFVPKKFKTLLSDGIVYETRRTKAPWVDVPKDIFDIESLESVHSLRDYGDADEEIYRQLFAEGYTRIVICVPDKDGILSEKVYYMQNEKVSIATLTYPDLGAIFSYKMYLEATS